MRKWDKIVPSVNVILRLNEFMTKGGSEQLAGRRQTPANRNRSFCDFSFTHHLN
jgi:hypothetical protein